ncbi:MAG: GTPase domain-containing protein [Synergistes sp.]|nr:GTPase domain-containing protein [Synergistes sp.]
MKERYANIMLLGPTGVGKSSFINYIVGEDVCKTGMGRPVTQGFDEFTYEDVEGLPLRIYDSKGLEVKDYDEIRNDIVDFIKERCGSDDVKEWIHSIFYCINLDAARLTDAETELLRRLRKDIAQNIHIIMTHYTDDEAGYEKLRKMTREVRKTLGDEKIHVFPVNSVEKATRRVRYELYGREEILDKIFELLWSDIAHKVAHDYSHDFVHGLKKIIDKVETAMNRFLDRLSGVKLIGLAIRDKLDDYSDELEENIIKKCSREIDDEIERLNDIYLEKIESLVEFCEGYGSSLGMTIQFCDFGDFADFGTTLADAETEFYNTKMAKAFMQLENAKNTWQQIVVVPKLIYYILTVSDTFKEVFASLLKNVRARLLDREAIEERVYAKLTEEFREEYPDDDDEDEEEEYEEDEEDTEDEEESMKEKRFVSKFFAK